MKVFRSGKTGVASRGRFGIYSPAKGGKNVAGASYSSCGIRRRLTRVCRTEKRLASLHFSFPKAPN